MKLKTIIFCLAIIYIAYSVVILQSTTSTTIVSPTGASTLYSNYYNSLHKDIAGKGVQWITSSKTTSPTRYQNLFYTSCTGNGTISITAATSFYVYLDGAYIGYGNNRSKIYTFSLKFSCGNHNLTIWVYTTAGTNSGLTFSINQDHSKCYKCESAGYWNEYSCKCLCIASPCTCTSPKLWRDYPICGCRCPAYRFLADEVKAEEKKEDPKAAAAAPAGNTTSKAIDPAIVIPILCLYPRYYSQSLCRCVCRLQYCPKGQYFDEITCQCLYIILT
jgi:hypothetical protein